MSMRDEEPETGCEGTAVRQGPEHACESRSSRVGTGLGFVPLSESKSKALTVGY